MAASELICLDSLLTVLLCWGADMLDLVRVRMRLDPDMTCNMSGKHLEVIAHSYLGSVERAKQHGWLFRFDGTPMDF